jgi:ferritin-like metal-binding protein YciE
MPTKVSNPRDLVLLVLGDLLFVERRLASHVLPELISQVEDAELKSALQEHHDETKTHVTRLETAFRRLDAAPSAALSRAFEGAVAQHEQVAPNVVEPRLRDLFHAHAALRTEHYELAGYDALLRLAPDLEELLAPSRDDERHAARALEQALERLAKWARAR